MVYCYNERVTLVLNDVKSVRIMQHTMAISDMSEAGHYRLDDLSMEINTVTQMCKVGVRNLAIAAILVGFALRPEHVMRKPR
jgi:hypothetical protein